ncbi:hypothetical protein [Actinomadura algeriensis]|uniref:Uncharacterized protein n=1 Tax=Actinomadura algeriensis TaxID=1679523 RepID=A0ABR9JRB3_9ACTN|nr:hypothetical protein [Actinomadura algeriensis]MBE1533107.1 hypothetical protein [Actinomadura algeriensis]
MTGGVAQFSGQQDSPSVHHSSSTRYPVARIAERARSDAAWRTGGGRRAARFRG